MNSYLLLKANFRRSRFHAVESVGMSFDEKPSDETLTALKKRGYAIDGNLLCAGPMWRQRVDSIEQARAEIAWLRDLSPGAVAVMSFPATEINAWRAVTDSDLQYVDTRRGEPIEREEYVDFIR